MMQGIILAAGRGKRLQPLSSNRTKAMMPVLGKPIIERVMEYIAANGVKDFILIVSPDDKDIRDYFRNESRLEASIRFVDQPQQKGMAHALNYAVPFIQEDFILSACDNIVSANHVKTMLELWEEFPSVEGLLTLMPIKKEKIRSSSAVSLEGGWVTGIVEKPHPDTAPSNIASLPLYCFSRSLLYYLPKVQPSPRGEYELQDAIQMMIKDGGKVRGIKVEKRLTLTSAADLLAINRHYLIKNGNSAHNSPKEVGANTRFIDPFFIEGETAIGAECIIGPNVFIEKGCRIGNNVKVHDAIVLQNSRIPDGATVENEVFIEGS